MVQAGTYFPKVRRMLFYLSPLIWGYFWPASTLLHGRIALATLSPLVTDPQILEHWGYADEVHLGISFQAMDFGLECQLDVQRPLWILHIGSVSVCLSSSARSMRLHILKYATQLSCTFQRSHCTFVAIIFRPFALLFSNLAIRIRAPFTKSASIRRLVNQAYWRMPFFHRMDWCKFLWGNPCRAIETFLHSDSFLWDFGFSTHFSHSAAWRNSETDSAVSFFHVCWHRDGNCNCLLQNAARWIPIANNIQEFFVHDVLPLDSWPRRLSHNFRFWLQNF